MSMSAELEHVSKSYGSIKALDDVTLKIPKGEIFTLIGPNGSGKTTLLKVLGCLEKQDSGNVYFDGERVENKNRNNLKRNTTVVFQKTTLFNSSVYNNIAYGLKLRKTPKGQIDKTVEKTLKMVKLSGYAKRPAMKLSGGEQQRVSLARALALNTPLLLLDEPTANLDPKSTSIIEEIVRQVNKENHTTIVTATHNIFHAEQTSGKAAFLINGKIAEIGDIQTILKGESKNLTKFARLENIFTGTSEILREGSSRIKFSDEVAIEAAMQKTGRVTVFVRPEDIILSKNRLESSARNVFNGKIVEILDQGPLVRLKIDAGKEFTVQITKRSFSEMGLSMGTQIYLTFKASSVQLV